MIEIEDLARAMQQVNHEGGAEPFVKADGGSQHDWSEHARRVLCVLRGEHWKEQN